MVQLSTRIKAWLKVTIIAMIVSLPSICAKANAILPSRIHTVDAITAAATDSISDIPADASITNAAVSLETAATGFNAAQLATDSITTDSVVKKPGFFRRLLKSIAEGNQKPIGKKMVWSFVAGPGYGSDTKFGIGLCVTGMYRTDSLTLPSLLSIYSNVCTSGNVLLGVDGYHIFPGDKSRIDYNLFGSYYPKYYWGIGYDKGIDHSNKGSIKDTRVTLTGGYTYQFVKHLYAGPMLDLTSAWALKRDSIAMANWSEDQPTQVLSFGVGVQLYFDTRDNHTATKKGTYVLFKQMFYPKFFGNKMPFGLTEIKLLQFCPVWKGGTLAFALQGKFGFGDVPWSKMPTFGGSYLMRGYYEGRFQDRCMVNAIFEVRQHIWRWFSAATWVGAGTVENKLKDFTFKHVLPCAGLGIRFEIRQNSSIRLDVGFGKQDMGIAFRINEAF